MTADPKLIELAAKALDARGWPNRSYERAEVVIAAINASGEWWVAPVEPDADMTAAAKYFKGAGFNEVDHESPRKTWAAMRTAYLAKTAEEQKP